VPSIAKEMDPGDGGSRKKLAAACRGMTRCAIPAPRKGHDRQGPGRDNVARGVPKGRTLKRRQRMCQECSNGISNHDLKGQLCLGSKMAFKKTFRLEVAKWAVEFSIRAAEYEWLDIVVRRPLWNETRDYTQSKSRRLRGISHSR
jgi:hypothetical protein